MRCLLDKYATPATLKKAGSQTMPYSHRLIQDDLPVILVVEHIAEAVAHFMHIFLMFLTEPGMQFTHWPAVFPFEEDQQGGHIGSDVF